MDFHQFLKKYVWDDTKTPYLVSPDRLNKIQADREIFLYAFFLAILFGLVTVVLFAETRLDVNYRAIWKATFSLSLLCSAIILGIAKHRMAALYCLTAPVAALLYVLNGGLKTDLDPFGKFLFFAFTALWLWYAWRVVAIARAYPHMAGEGEGP